jgi:hypothetical protein
VTSKRDQTENRQPTVVPLNSIQVEDKYEPMMTVNNIKFCNATVGNKSTHISHVCGPSPKEINRISVIQLRIVISGWRGNYCKSKPG